MTGFAATSRNGPSCCSIWTAALTRLAQQPALDADYAALREQFSEREMIDLSLAIAAINSWNRWRSASEPSRRRKKG